MALSGPREKGSRSCHCQGEIAPRVLADSSPKGASTSSFIHAAPGNCELVKRLPAPNLECTSEAPCDPALASRTLPPGSWPDSVLPTAWRGVTPPSHPGGAENDRRLAPDAQ